jgi:hypothetical protein
MTSVLDGGVWSLQRPCMLLNVILIFQYNLSNLTQLNMESNNKSAIYVYIRTQNKHYIYTFIHLYPHSHPRYYILVDFIARIFPHLYFLLFDLMMAIQLDNDCEQGTHVLLKYGVTIQVIIFKYVYHLTVTCLRRQSGCIVWTQLSRPFTWGWRRSPVTETF